jgi:hypothetical protein
MSDSVSIEFFEWRQRVLDIKVNNVVIDQVETPESELSLYKLLYSNNTLTLRRMLKSILKGRKLNMIYMHDTDKPEKYADVIGRLIFYNSVKSASYRTSIEEVMLYLDEESKMRYRRLHEHPEHMSMFGHVKAYKIPESSLASVISSKARNSTFRKIYENKTSQTAAPGRGPADIIRKFAGINVPKGAQGGKRTTKKGKKAKKGTRKYKL